jgi:hypothetical protein
VGLRLRSVRRISAESLEGLMRLDLGHFNQLLSVDDQMTCFAWAIRALRPEVHRHQ